MNMRSLLLTALLLSGCATVPEVPLDGLSQEEIRLVDSGGKALTVLAEIADSEERRRTGLMHRTDLPPDTGMLFVFEREQPMSFWMKNTLLPLDVLFFDSDGAFVSSTTMVPCVQDPCPMYPSEGPALLALEVPAGFVKLHRIDAGWSLKRD